MTRPNRWAGWSADRAALAVGYAACTVILAATFTRSFAATADFAVRVGAARPGLDAWLVPIGVDVAIIAASVLAWASARSGARNSWAYALFVFAAGTSIGLNVAHVPLPGAAQQSEAATWWARFIAALPPVLLLWTTEVLLRHVPTRGPQSATQDGTGRSSETVVQPVGGAGQPLEQVWAAVATYCAAQPVRPSQNAVARALGLPRTTVQRAITAHRTQWDVLADRDQPHAAGPDHDLWAELDRPAGTTTAVSGNGRQPQ